MTILWLNYLITILAIVASILAWLAKIKWSKEFKEAKNAEIEAKNAQLDSLRERAELYESLISQKLINHSKQTIRELEDLLDRTEKAKYEEVKKILDLLQESENNFIHKYQKKNELRISNTNRLFAILSHEVRTPLNAILGFSEIIGTDTKVGKDNKEYIEIIKKNTHELLNIIDIHRNNPHIPTVGLIVL